MSKKCLVQYGSLTVASSISERPHSLEPHEVYVEVRLNILWGLGCCAYSSLGVTLLMCVLVCRFALSLRELDVSNILWSGMVVRSRTEVRVRLRENIFLYLGGQRDLVGDLLW